MHLFTDEVLFFQDILSIVQEICFYNIKLQNTNCAFGSIFLNLSGQLYKKKFQNTLHPDHRSYNLFRFSVLIHLFVNFVLYQFFNLA